MNKSTHTERVAVALAMRDACVLACASLAGDGRADGISQNERILVSTAVNACKIVDVMEVMAPLGDSFDLTEREAFELAAKAHYFSVQRNDRGEYATPVTERAYKVWKMAMQFKAGTPMTDIAPEPPADTSTVTVTIAGMPARMPVADAALLGLAPTTASQAVQVANEALAADAVSAPAVADAMIAATKAAMLTGTGALLVAGTPDGMTADVVDVVLPAGPPTLKLGRIGELLGFTVTADFLLSLGFAPAATEKNSKLFHMADFPRICAALRLHIDAVQAQF